MCYGNHYFHFSVFRYAEGVPKSSIFEGGSWQ